MFKSYKIYITYIVLSILAVLFAKYINNFITFILTFYDAIDNKLTFLFSKSNAGIISRNSVALVICPLIIIGIPALIYFAIKRTKMPYFIESTWLTWMILVVSNLLIK
jgi:hypothetical protein